MPVVQAISHTFRIVTILIVMVGVLSGVFASGGGFEFGETATCCVVNKCVPVTSSQVAGQQVSSQLVSGQQDRQQFPVKNGCTDCTILCKLFDRPMVPPQVTVIALADSEKNVGYGNALAFTPLNHLTGVFKPPKA